MIRTSMRAAAVVALAAGLASCSGQGEEDSEFDGRIVIWADEVRAPVLSEAAAEFEADSNVEVVVEEHADELSEDYLTAVEQGQSPDIVVGPHDWLGDFVRNGAVAPIELTEEQQNSLIPEALEAASFEGQTYAVPYAMENLALLRNAELAPDSPATFDDLVEAGRAAVAAGEAEEALITEVGADGNPYHGFPIFTSMGGYLFGETAEGDPDPEDVGVDSEGGVAAFEKFYELGEAGDGVLRTSMDADNAIPSFVAGEVPFLISGPWAVSDAVDAGIDLAVEPIPGFAGEAAATPFIGVQAFFVSSQAPNPVFAEEFVSNYVLAPELALSLYEADPRMPTLIDAYESVAADDPFLEGFQSAAAGASPMPAVPEMNAVWEPFGRAMADCLDGTKDGETAAQDAAEAIRQAISDGR